MKYCIIFLLVNLLRLSSCTKKEVSTDTDSCITSELNTNLNYNDLVFGIPPEIIAALVERPDENGALGRNKDGYFHVRFQFDMPYLTDYAISFQRKDALEGYLKNLDYSFSYQNLEGDFKFIAPDYLLEKPNYQPPSQADLASGTAFFAYSLGLSLNSLNQSDWYKSTTSLGTLRNDIELLDPNIESMMEYLKSSVNLLEEVDSSAPNRLLFNAIAFYSLGIHLKDQEAKNIGINFANKALSQGDETEGYFIEGGGWDSSYNGVAIKLGFELFTLITINSENLSKNEIEKIVSCATDWQKSRVLSTGEISTAGNTRVFSGGEEFLGNEKGVDVIKTVKAFFYMNTLSNENQYESLAQKIIEYYQ